jgi:hypothetical protein
VYLAPGKNEEDCCQCWNESKEPVDEGQRKADDEDDGNLVAMLQNFLSPSLMTRPYKLEGLPLVTLSSQFLEIEGKARTNPIGGPFRCFLLG